MCTFEKYTNGICTNAFNNLIQLPDTAYLLNSLYNYDSVTYYHCNRVSLLATKLGFILGYPEDVLYNLAMSGLLHDIGKLKIDLSILNSPNRLTALEVEKIRKHVEYGEKMLKPLPLNEMIKIGAAQHHEMLDGTGYPRKLKGSSITPFGQILAVCDIYDALSNKRPYKRALSNSECAEKMVTNKGLNQELVKTLFSFV